MSAGVAGVTDVAIQGLDVIAVRIPEIGGVVARAVVAVARRAVRLEARFDSGTVEAVDLVLRLRVEAEMEVLRRRPPIDDVDVREASLAFALVELRNLERERGRSRRT
jgi:hypothetical protein